LPRLVSQPVAAVVEQLGVHVDGSVAAYRAGRHRTGAGAMRDDPAEAAEDRGGAGAQHTAGAVSVGSELPAPRVVCDRRGAAGQRVAATGAVPGTGNNGGRG